MKRETELSDVFYDKSGKIKSYVAEGLGLNFNDINDCLALGIVYQNKIVGGVVYCDFQNKTSAWINIYTDNKHWCSQKTLKQIFGIGFDVLKCRRINALINTKNKSSISLAKRCGFKREGKMRQFRDDGQDVFVFGMLRNECKFINNTKKEK